MKESCLILLVVVCVATAISIVDNDWETYKTKFNKQYSAEEDVERRKIFYKHKMMIEEHNQKFKEGKVTYEMGINKFTDMILEETSYLRGYKHDSNEFSSSKSNLVFHAVEGAPYPDTVDWRESGYVTPVKEQGGECGSSWAFSATGALEGQNFAKTGTLVSLSEQNLIDCDDTNKGCLGGYPHKAFEFVRDNKGIDTEDSYPYVGRGHRKNCTYDPKNIGGYCSGFATVQMGNEYELMAATATFGPISVEINANNPTFNMYQSGVYYEPGCSEIVLNHAVLVVGYGKEGYFDYWLVKNSWGTEWGEEGYIKMARNLDNNCGIATNPTWPLV